MHTDVNRFYAVLGVDPAASEKAIRVAFRIRAKALHPDSPSGNANAFILLKRAYDTLVDRDQRAAYDLACRPPRPAMAEASRPHRYGTPPPPPPQSRSASPRRGGVGFVRYVVAFLVMAAISLGGVQAMISLTGAPPSIQTRSAATHVEAAATPAAETSTAPGSSPSGFWDATPAKKTP